MKASKKKGIVKRQSKVAAAYKKYSTGFPMPLKIIASGSLIIVLLQELWLFHMKAPFPFANELGTVLEKILLSFVASITIYFFTTHFPKVRRLDSVRVIISNSFFRISHLAMNLVYTVYDHAGITFDKSLGPVTKESIEKIVTREGMRSEIVFTYDSIRYRDTMELLSALKVYFDQYHRLVTPYLDLLPKATLSELNGIVNQIYLIHDPVQLLKERTMISPGIFAEIIATLVERSSKLRI